MESKPDLSKLRIERSASAPASPLRWPLIALGLAALCLLIFFVRRPAETVESKTVEQAAGRPAAFAQARAQTSFLTATGYVVAQRKAAVSSKATGRLNELNVVEGDKVKKGDVIGVLENADLAALVRSLEADIEAAKARIKFAEAEKVDADIQRKRKAALVRENAISAADLDQANARANKAAADVEVTKANVAVLQAQLDKAKIDLDYTFIRAPFDGTVLTKNADVGEIVAPFGASVDARAAIVTIADMSSLEVEADVSEANITRIRVGQRCRITLDSFPGKIYEGTVSNIVPTVDRAKATVLAKIKFISKDDSVIPEMSAKVEFLEGEGQDAAADRSR